MANYTMTVDAVDGPECPVNTDCEWNIRVFHKNGIHQVDKSDFYEVTDYLEETVTLKDKYRQLMDVGLCFWLDKYEHSRVRYSLHGAGMQCQWDTMRYAGIMWWPHDESHIGSKTMQERIADAKLTLDQYNDWCNGHVYEAVVRDVGVFPAEQYSGEFVDSMQWYGSDEPCLPACLQEGDVVLVGGSLKSMLSRSMFPAGVKVHGVK
jgi:hypothetical protein